MLEDKEGTCKAAVGDKGQSSKDEARDVLAGQGQVALGFASTVKAPQEQREGTGGLTGGCDLWVPVGALWLRPRECAEF